MTDWPTSLPDLTADTRAKLAALPVVRLAKSSALFHPGDVAQGFVIVLSGRIEVTLTSLSGREIFLYAVEPGQSCVQTTLGLMGGEPYEAGAIAATDLELVLVPRGLFSDLMASDPGFRGHVLASFGRRMQEMTRLLEQVAFVRIESRLAAALLSLETQGNVTATHAELAARIGSAREVVTRRLDGFAREGWVQLARGSIEITDAAALRQLATLEG